MDVALVEDAQHDIDGDQRRENKDRLVAKRGLEGPRRSLKAASYTVRKADFVHGFLDCSDGVAKGQSWLYRKRQRSSRELTLMIDGQYRICRFEARHRAQRDLR